MHGLEFFSTSSLHPQWLALITLPNPSPSPPKFFHKRGRKSWLPTWPRYRQSEHLTLSLHQECCATTAPLTLSVKQLTNIYAFCDQEADFAPICCPRAGKCWAHVPRTFLKIFGLLCQIFVGFQQNSLASVLLLQKSDTRRVAILLCNLHICD